MDNKKRAWEQLRTRYWGVFLVLFVIGLLVSAMTSVPVFGWIAAIILIGPISVFTAHYFLQIAIHDVEADKYEESVKVVQTNFSKLITPYLLLGLYTFLWSFVPVVGIIKTYSYSQTMYILAKNPGISGNEAITMSRELMDGHKMELFLLHLSFIGWFILGMLAFGVGIFFVMPYFNLTLAHFHKELTDNNIDINTNSNNEEKEFLDQFN